MLILRMFHASARTEQAQRFAELRAASPVGWRPLVLPTLEAQAAILAFSPEGLREAASERPRARETDTVTVDGEIFTDGRSLIAIALKERPLHRRAVRAVGHAAADVDTEAFVEVAYVSAELECDALAALCDVTRQRLNIDLQPYFYPSESFERLKTEGRESPANPTPEELASASLLAERPVRTIAIAIKASGGLLVRDLAKQLPQDARDQTDKIQRALREHGLIDSEIVVVCSKSQSQSARAPSREVLDALSKQGLRCACGRAIADERIEEALTLTDAGRVLLDKSRWLTVLLQEELRRVGVPLEHILVEQQVGGDEIDCLAIISGELALFELKDKEFNLGNAYSFGAKIGILQPQHPVIIATDGVGGDAKDHFQRAQLAQTTRPRYDPFETGPAAIRYIEGVENLHSGIVDLASTIYRDDSVRLLDRILPLASLSGRSLVRVVQRAGPPTAGQPLPN